MTETKNVENETPEDVQPEAGSPDGSEQPTETEEPKAKEGPSDPSGSAEQQLASVREQLLRKAADFENYKKRMEADIQNIVRLANENLIISVLPIVDDLERSLKAGKSTEDVAAFHKGVELIYQKLQKILETNGVTPIETAGRPFDVHYHDALMQLPKKDTEPNTILEEVEKGYSLNGKVIRHAKVIVAAPPAEDTDEHEPPAKDGDA